MKKIMVILVVLSIVFSLTGCGGAKVPTSKDTDDYNDASEVQNATLDTSNAETLSNSNNTEWKQFIKDYNAWVDEYIKIVKKYKANPTDLSIMTDYTKMISEMTDWAERSEKLEEELDTTDALEFAAELAKIAQKLAEVAK